MKPFTPSANTSSVTITGTTASVAITKPATGASGTVRLHNGDTALCYIAFGTSTVEAAVATSHPIPAGGVQDFDIGGAVTHVAVIGGANTLKLFATFGQSRN